MYTFQNQETAVLGVEAGKRGGKGEMAAPAPMWSARIK